MTAPIDFDATGAPGGTLVRSSLALAVRGARSIRRLPSAFFPALLMPIVQAIAFSGTYYAITRIPGFPTDRSINWFLPLACTMGSGFSGIGLGFTTIRDIESGFLDRLRMSPSPSGTHLLGPLVSCWLRVLLVVTIVLLVGFAFGARLTGGVLGLVTLYVGCLGVATIAAGWALGLAFRLRDMRAAALMQLTFFNAIFLSNAQTPLSIMTGWLHAVARVNPMTNILRLGRQGFLGGVTWDQTWGGLVAILGLSALSMWFAARGFRKLSDA